MTKPIYLLPAEKSLVKEYLEDGIESCEHDIEHCKHQKQVKYEKGQMERVKDYERQIAEAKQLRRVLQNILSKFEDLK